MSADIQALERAEIDASLDLYRAASPEVAEAAGLSVTARASLVVVAAAHVDVLALNRVLALGLNGPAPAAELDEVFDILVRCGSPRFFVPVAPVNDYLECARVLEHRGLRHYNNWIRLTRTLTDVPDAGVATLDVREIGQESADEFGRIVATAFGFPPAMAPLAGQVVGRPRWRHYLAYDGTTPVAAAAMFLTGGTAWFGFAATEAAHRKRGAQRALVVRRLRDAVAAGCTAVSVETAEDSVTKDAPSFRNLMRLGFTVTYSRPNYLWTRPAS